MRSVLGAVAGIALAVGVVAAPAAAEPVQPSDVAQDRPVGPQTCTEPPITAGYYRMWRDVATTKEADRAPNVQRLDDVPAEVDIVSVFATPPQDDPDFWAALQQTYLPALHAQGTEVVFTIFVDAFIGDEIEMTQESYDAVALDLYETYIVQWGLDGLDIDVERELSGDDLTRATGVLTALAEHIGPTSGTDHLYIYDTNLTGAHPLFQALAPSIDYVFLQAYGRGTSGMQATWETFAPFISSCQFLPGFSFYEERGGRWGDVQVPFETSRAVSYADWQPVGGEKGGVFAYAIERDGKVEGDDTITRTDFSWLIRLHERQLAADRESDTARPSIALAVSGSAVTVTASDDGLLRRVAANLYDVSGRTFLRPVGSTSAGLPLGVAGVEQSWQLPADLPPGTYTIRAAATDFAGRTGVTTTTTITVPSS